MQLVPSKLLFTPGPLTTSATVKAAMLRDRRVAGQRFYASVRNIRERLLASGPQPAGDTNAC